ncbi:MAG TPA: acyl--CoA ligase family protein [Ktedonobacteraceae bacterium]|nr:acyl--CoA ligase family protein [Ktedonobacteraceae bacterium]
MSEKVYRTELTPVSFLERGVLVFPNKIAVVHGQRRYTYQEFAGRAYRLASRLRSVGMQKHDRVAFLCPNIPPLLEAHFGVPAAGGILVAINIRLSTHEVEYILRHSGSKYLFVDDELYPVVAALNLEGITVVHISDTGTEDDPYEQFLAAGTPEPVVSWLEDEEETISINYTSGTTGNPKGVMYTYRGGYLNALSEVMETGMSSRSVYLWTLPMFHCNGWCFTWGVTAIGATHVCLRQVDPARIWELFEQEGITHYNGAPTVQIFLANAPNAHPLKREITATIAGAPPSPTLLAQLKKLNIRAVHVYGLTETYGPYTVCEWQSEWDTLPEGEQARLLARQGQGMVTAERARVINPDMQDVAHDGQSMGEVVMRGNNVAKGYYENPEATAKAFAGGWFHSGDIGVAHSDSYIELRDRAKDIIISGGENISTIEVEQLVAQHPAVLECAIVAIPDETWGERPKAFVTLKEGQSATEQEIIAFCRERVAHFKCPAAVAFGPLPKTSTGKVQKYVLREKEWAGQDKRIN